MMKKIIFVLIILLQTLHTVAQVHFESFLLDGKVWTLNRKPVFDPNQHYDLYINEEMKLVGDTVIDGIHYGQIYHREWRSDQVMSDEWINTNKYIGQDGGKIYQYYSSTRNTRLDMDFSLKVGNRFNCQFFYDTKDTLFTFVVTSVSDTIMENTTDKKPRKCIHIQSEINPNLSEVWIEGIGSLQYGLLGFTYYFGKSGAITKMVKCVDGNEIIYNNIITNIQSQKISKNEYYNNVIYDINGYIVQLPQKGIYIQNGKKKVIK